jgi:hypothetical protein
MKRVKKHKPLTDEEMAQLKIKPQWWLAMHEPIEVEAYKMPFGIQAKAEHNGVKYEGMLYPVEKETTK